MASRSADDPRRPLRCSCSEYLRVFVVVAPCGQRGSSASELTLFRERRTSMSETIDLFVPLDESDEPLGPRVERALGWPRGQLGELQVLLRSLDARKGRPLGHRLRIAAHRRGEPAPVVSPPRPP